jgi:zinc-ribbons
MENVNKKYYCPTCKEELEMLSGCGAVGYFCNHCRKLVSRTKMLLEPTEVPQVDIEELTTTDKR